MTVVTPFLLRVYLPIAIALVLAVMAWKLDFPEGLEGEDLFVPVSVGHVTIGIPIPTQLRRAWIARGALVALSTGIFVFGISANFARFFPTELRMDVYFDEAGLSQLHNDLTPSQRTELRIAPGWHDQVAAYDSIVRDRLSALWSVAGSAESAALVAREHLHAHGETTFQVERVSVLSYRLEESAGYLTHSIEAPGEPVSSFRTEFSLRRSAADHFRPSLGELVGGRFLIRPEFNQILLTTRGPQRSVVLDHTVVGVTRVATMPFPSFDKTLYLWKRPDGHTVPVAYAVYY